MDRLFALIALAALLVLAPLHSAGEADVQPVLFSLLFPQLMPETDCPAWLSDWLGGAAGEAVML